MSKCKPDTSPKDLWNAVADVPELCELFMNFFLQLLIQYDIQMKIHIHNRNYLADVLNNHRNHESKMKIKENHTNNITFNLKHVKPDYVLNILSKLKINKATGYDNVPPKMVKICAEELSETLAELVNQTFTANRFHEDMKKA